MNNSRTSNDKTASDVACPHAKIAFLYNSDTQEKKNSDFEDRR